jgi:hypothetical protein
VSDFVVKLMFVLLASRFEKQTAYLQIARITRIAPRITVVWQLSEATTAVRIWVKTNESN